MQLRKRFVFGSIGIFALVAVTGSARAGVTYSQVFRTTDVNGDVIAGGTASGTDFTFISEAVAQACNAATGEGCPVVDVLLFLTNTNVHGFSTSIGFDNSRGLGTVEVSQWYGIGQAYPLGSVSCDDVQGFCGSFNAINPPPIGAAMTLPVGTYNIGTIVWDTSAASGGLHAVFSLYRPGFDFLGLEIPQGSGNLVDGSGIEVRDSGFINIIPEPATAGLLGLGLLLGVMLRRRAG